MVTEWTAKPSPHRDGLLMIAGPPAGCCSVCIGDALPEDPSTLFAGDYFDLLLPHDREPLTDRLARLTTWADVEEWIAIRDTPQTRWLGRVYDVNGHLGLSMLKLMHEKQLTVRRAD